MELSEMKIGQRVLIYIPAGEWAETSASWDVGETQWQDAHWHETEIKGLHKSPVDPYAIVKDGWWDASYHCKNICPDECLLTRDGTIIYVEQD
jgi:hypothetical protein